MTSLPFILWRTKNSKKILDQVKDVRWKYESPGYMCWFGGLTFFFFFKHV